MADRLENALVRKLYDIAIDAAVLTLLRYEVLFRDLEFFTFRVARKVEYLKAVLQRRWYRVEHVRRGDKEDLRQVVIDIQVVIAKCAVLFGIKYLEQRGARVTPVVAAEFV